MTATAFKTEACPACRSMVNLIPQATSATPLAVDVDRDPNGTHVAERHPRKGWVVREIHPGELIDATRPRYTPHRDTCPARSRMSTTAGPCCICDRTIELYGEHSEGTLCKRCRGLTVQQRLDLRHGRAS